MTAFFRKIFSGRLFSYLEILKILTDSLWNHFSFWLLIVLLLVRERLLKFWFQLFNLFIANFAKVLLRHIVPEGGMSCWSRYWSSSKIFFFLNFFCITSIHLLFLLLLNFWFISLPFESLNKFCFLNETHYWVSSNIIVNIVFVPGFGRASLIS
jgi:hypothetical protein